MEYQKIEFGDVKIEGKDRYPEYRLIFPEPPKNKTMLDVGCNIGYYCFQAHTEGAKKCIGIDTHSAFIDTANDIKEKLEFENIEFKAEGVGCDKGIGVCTYKGEKVDIVIALYVFHHFSNIKDAAFAIKQCYLLANELVVFGILDWPYSEAATAGILVNPKGNKKLAFTMPFFEELFPNDDIEIFPSAIVKDRSIVKIWKRRHNA